MAALHIGKSFCHSQVSFTVSKAFNIGSVWRNCAQSNLRELLHSTKSSEHSRQAAEYLMKITLITQIVSALLFITVNLPT